VVGPDSGVLTVVVRQNPINVTFPVSQRQLLEIRKSNPNQDTSAIRVKIRLPDGSTYGETGRINFVDVQTDKTTDTALVQAEVPNPKGVLSDGQFVGISVEGDKPVEAVVIPQSAVQIDQAGTFVLVVSADNKVEQRRVKLGRGPAGQSVVESGVEPGTLVITEGAQRARPGSAVTPRPASAG
jgi:membrane fusion protein, multidrug efflux system